MSRIETSGTGMDVKSMCMYIRQPAHTRTPPARQPGQQGISGASAIRTSMQVQKNRAQSTATSNLYGTSRKTATPSASALTTQLLQADARIKQLLQRQPDFQLVIATAFRAALNTAFPDVRQPLDPDHIYVTEYVNATIVLSGDNRISERRPTSSATLSEVLQKALNSGHIPSYDTAQTDFFYAAGNAVNNPEEVVHGMDTGLHITAFENLLRTTVERSASDYQQVVKEYWNQPDRLPPSRDSPQTRLISAYREQRQAEAALCSSDTTLSATGKRWLDQIYATDQTGTSANPPGFFTLALKAALQEAIDLQAAFDITDIQDTRQQLLTEKFLQNASTDDIDKWRTELQQYQAVLKKTQTSGLPLMRQYLDPAFLYHYARDKVREQVQRDLGFDIDPDQLVVTTQNYIEYKPPIPANTTKMKRRFLLRK